MLAWQKWEGKLLLFNIELIKFVRYGIRTCSPTFKASLVTPSSPELFPYVRLLIAYCTASPVMSGIIAGHT